MELSRQSKVGFSNNDNQASSFDSAAKLIEDLTAYQLYRLQAHIEVLIEDPTRLKPIAQSLTKGQKVEYFCRSGNRCIPAVVKKVNRTTVSVINLEDGESWRVDLASINTGDSQDYAQPPRSSGPQLSRSDLSVGQVVGFQDRDNEDRFGTIIRLNPKTVTLECESGTKWRVSYAFLFSVLDCESSNHDNNDGPRQQLLID